MKRYLLFAGDQYYPSGGWHDLSGEFDSIEEAEEYVFERGYEWWHVVDMRFARRWITPVLCRAYRRQVGDRG